MQSHGVCLSVRPSVCKPFFAQIATWIATKLAHNGPHMGLHPGCAQGLARSKVAWYGHFSDYTKIASSTTNMTGSRPNLHTMVPTWNCIQGVLKVKGHVIQALMLWRNVCYTVRSHVLSLHTLTLWNTIILSFQYKYQAARCLNTGMSYSVIDGLVLANCC